MLHSGADNPRHVEIKHRVGHQNRDRQQFQAFQEPTERGHSLKVLVVASKGGHWEQMMLLRDIFEPYHVTYATTDPALLDFSLNGKAHIVPDCNRDTPLPILASIRACFRLVTRIRPDYVISTGAMPGLFCILAGRMIGAETIWLDSFANAERLSMCGTIASRVANTCLTQWEHLARPGGPSYAGSIL